MGSIPGLAWWIKDPVLLQAAVLSCRHGSEEPLLWLWHRQAAAALIRPPARKIPYASGANVKKKFKMIIRDHAVICQIFPDYSPHSNCGIEDASRGEMGLFLVI